MVTEHENSFTIAQMLLDWYATTKRSLPWRDQPDPYHIWVAEVMAQQTQIMTMLPYYQRFIAGYPDVFSLANASLEEILRMWTGLGYYRRAENLYRAAQLVTESGRMPDTYEGWIRLPGVGEYMAGAIMSTAFQKPYPAVDGNVMRVCARINLLEDSVGSLSLKKKTRSWVMEMIPRDLPGDFNQALMELGATVCRPHNPECKACPLRERCAAWDQGTYPSYPVRKPTKVVPVIQRTVFILKDEFGRFCMQQRKESLLKGMWEYLAVDGNLDPNQAEAFLTAKGFRIAHLRPLPSNRHAFSHLEWKMSGYFANLNQAPESRAYQWVKEADLVRFAIPVAYRPFTQWIQTHGVQ